MELIGFIGFPSQYWRTLVCRPRIFKRLRSPGIVSKESILPACVAWRASTPNRVDVPARQAGNRLLGSLKCLQIRAQIIQHPRALFRHLFWNSAGLSGIIFKIKQKVVYISIAIIKDLTPKDFHVVSAPSSLDLNLLSPRNRVRRSDRMGTYSLHNCRKSFDPFYCFMRWFYWF